MTTLAATTLVLCVLGIIASLNTRVTRTLVADAVNRALVGYFCGQITVEHIEHIGLTGVNGMRVSIDDPQGNRVLSLNRLDARFALLPTLSAALLNRKALSLTIAELSLDQVALSLQSDASDRLNLQHAFRVCAPPTKSSGSVRLAIRKIRAQHLTAHMEVLGVPAFDAQLQDVVASLILIPEKLAIDIDQFAIATRGLLHGADVRGTGHVKFVLPLSDPHELLARLQWAGSVYGTELFVELQWLAGLLRLEVDAPRVEASSIHRFWNGFPQGPETSLHAELQGTPPEFSLRTRLARGSGSLGISGQIRLGDHKRAELQVAAESVDLRQLFVGGPRSEIKLTGELSAQQISSGQLTSELRLDLPPNTIAGVTTPPASVEVNLLHVPGTFTNADARILAREAGAPAQLLGKLRSHAGGTEFTFEGDIRAPRLERVPRLQNLVQGTAKLDMQGKLDLSHGIFDAQIDLDANGLHRKDVDIREGHLHATAHGPMKSPRVDLDFDATGVRLAAARLSKVHLRARGPLAATRFDAELKTVTGADATLSGLLDIDPSLSIRDASATFNRGPETVTAKARLVSVRDTDLVVEHATLEGLGEPAELSLVSTRRELRVRAVGKGVDLSRLARITQTGDYGGLMDVDVDVRLAPNRDEGRVAVSLKHASVGAVRNVSVQAEATLLDDGVSLHVRGELGDGNWLELQTADTRLAGPANELPSWVRWSGRVGIDGQVNVADLLRQLRIEPTAVQQLQGILALRANVSHEATAHRRPNVDLAIQGSRLGFSLSGLDPSRRHTQEKAGKGSELPEFRQLKTNLSLTYNGESDQTHASVQLSDSEGELAVLGFTADTLPYASLLLSPHEGLQQLRETPFAAQLYTPRRALKSLPGELIPNRSRGEVESRLTWNGSLLRPDATLEARLTQARVNGLGLNRPMDLALNAHYDGAMIAGVIKAELDARPVFEADAQVAIRAVDWFTGSHGTLPWEASARARMTGFPLERIRSLSNNEVSGLLNGELAIEGLHRDARATLRLDAQKLRVRDLALSEGAAQVVVRPDGFDARIRLEENTAFAEARVSGASQWGDALLPSLDDSSTQRAALIARRFRVATFLPFTGGLFSDLDGRLDAEISAEIDRRARTAGLSGVASVQGGVLEFAAGGGEFHDIDAKLVLKPDGTVQLERLVAQGVSGRLQLTASARFDGFGWASAQAQLWVPANSPIPLTLEGAGYGTMFGQMDLLAVRAPNRRDILVNIDVPSLNVTLPATSTRTVRQLEPMQGVRLGSHQANGNFEPLPTRRREAQSSGDTEQTAQVKIDVNLGKEVKVTRSNSLEVTLSGHPQIVLADTIDFSGQIQLVRGFLDIEGKRFEIDQGTISFMGDDPTNPQADVTASWTAPEGTVVYAEFSGPLRTGRVTLRSDPPLPNNEIVALMLFGGSDSFGGSANQAKAGGSNMLGVAQGAATQPINHALQDYGLRGVSTRVDTSNVNPRPEVEVRIARDIALQIAWVLGTPPPGSNPDRTLFTIDWQFFKRWSLETTVGDAGTSIADVVWQYGY